MPSSASKPLIIYGTAWKKEQTQALVETALLEGFKAIDTACQPKHYYQAGVGNALERVAQQGIARESIFVQTKFTPVQGQDPKTIPYDPKSSLTQQVAESFVVSQRELKTHYVDSLVLHSPLFPYKDLLEVWRAMEAIYEQKNALQLGISNCYELATLKRLYEDATVKPTVVQNRFYRESGYDQELRMWCDHQGITYQSFWSLTANPHILGHKQIIKLALKYHKTQAQIFFRYLLHEGIVPLSGTHSKVHMHEDVTLLTFTLLEDEISSISTLLFS